MVTSGKRESKVGYQLHASKQLSSTKSIKERLSIFELDSSTNMPVFPPNYAEQKSNFISNLSNEIKFNPNNESY